VLEVYDWPTSGDASRVWAVNPDMFGWDQIVQQTLTFQPLRLNNAIADDGVVAPQARDVFNHITTFDRPGLLIDRGIAFDPWLETYLQAVGRWPHETYSRASHAPNKTLAGRDSVLAAVASKPRVPKVCTADVESSITPLRLAMAGCDSCSLGGLKPGLLVDGTSAEDDGLCKECHCAGPFGCFCEHNITGSKICIVDRQIDIGLCVESVPCSELPWPAPTGALDPVTGADTPKVPALRSWKPNELLTAAEVSK
jgi:hypothetical protein